MTKSDYILTYKYSLLAENLAGNPWPGSTDITVSTGKLTPNDKNSELGHMLVYSERREYVVGAESMIAPNNFQFAVA